MSSTKVPAKTVVPVPGDRKKKKTLTPACKPQSTKNNAVPVTANCPALPPGWKVFESKTRPGVSYYLFLKTGCTTWERPKSEDHKCSKLCPPAAHLKKTRKKRNRKKKEAKAAALVQPQEESAKVVKEEASKEVAVSVKLPSQVGQAEGQNATTLPGKPETASKKRSNSQSMPSDTKIPKPEPEPPVHFGRKRSSCFTDPEGKQAKVVKVEETALASPSKIIPTLHAPAKPGCDFESVLQAAKEINEGMEWEPIIASMSSNKEIKSGNHIVVDTNILLRDLDLVKKLLESTHEELKEAVVEIPLVVLQELDRFKLPNGPKPQLSSFAREAVRFIYNCLKMKHPRLRVQQVQDLRQLAKLNDDEILQCCQELRSNNAQVLLLSDDKNLSNKAASFKIPFHSAFSLRQLLFSATSSAEKGGNENSKIAVKPEKYIWQEVAKSAQDVFVNLFSEILTLEMMENFGALWIKVVLRKPPWSFRELMQCLDKHWIAVMSGVLERDAEGLIKASLANDVVNSSRSQGQMMCSKDAADAVQIYRELIARVKRGKHTKLCSKALADLECLHKKCFVSPSAASDDADMEMDGAPEMEPDFEKLPMKNSSSSVDVEVKICTNFENLWSFLSSFCERVRLSIEKGSLSQEPELISTINSYHSFINTFLDVHQRLLDAVQKGFPCDCNDLQEMKQLINKVPSNFLDVPELMFAAFYQHKRAELLLFTTRLMDVRDMTEKGISWLKSSQST